MSLTNILLIVILTIILVLIFAGLLTVIAKKNLRQDFVYSIKNLFKRQNNKIDQKEFFNNLSSSLLKLSSDKIGAIIAIEREESLSTYINVGYKVECDFSPEFIISVFYNKSSALHDGGVIVRDKKIVSISSYFPMTRQLLDVSYGARHRSAVGLSERVDAVVFIVSETNGRISVAQAGRIRRLSQNPDRLVDEVSSLLGDTSRSDNE